MYEKFAELADSELDMALDKLPSDPLEKFALFAEVTRALDYSAVFQAALENSGQLSRPDFDLLLWGWNAAMSHLLTPIRSAGLPLYKSTKDTRQFAMNLLHKFGQSVLLRRASAMLRSGFLHAQNTTEGLTVRLADGAKDQFLDDLEFDSFAKIHNQLQKQNVRFYRGWQLFENDDYPSVQEVPGYFLGRTTQRPLEKYKSENIDELMLPLVHPWDSGRGMMMGYGALPEVDNHFLAEAAEIVAQARDEAGLHPDAKLGNITGADLSAIITFVTAVHMKHVRFALLAMNAFPEISIPQSLTIWGPLNELEDSIVDYSRIHRDRVRHALDAIVLRPEEAFQLRNVTFPFLPLLLSVGNGLILRPVSSLVRNPFIAARTLFEWRHPNSSHWISEPREEWLRSEVYALFQGTRYQRVNGNVKIRRDHKVLTDVDAAVYDRLTGQLALFQLKWQDYFTNDVRELRSKARNLATELDTWAEKVDAWIKLKGLPELTTALRLKLNKGERVTSVYLFGLSRSYARMHGFGFPVTSEKLAICNWPQFLRTRYEIGPRQRVFSSMFERLRNEIDAKVDSRPMPYTVQVGKVVIRFEDLWSAFGEDDV